MRKIHGILILILLFAVFPTQSIAHNGARDELGGHFRTSDCMYLLHSPTALARTAANIDELIALIKIHNSNKKCGATLTADKIDLEGYKFPSPPNSEDQPNTDPPKSDEPPKTDSPKSDDKVQVQPTKGLNIHYINIGQGDSIYIKTPAGDDILIDGGSKASGSKVVAYLKKQKVDDIEVLISTHPDADHIGGLDEVLAAFKVKNVYAPKVQHTTQAFKDFLTAVKNQKLTIKTAKLDVPLPLNDKSIQAKFIGPVKDYNKTDLNNWSAVLQLTYNKNKFLFMGDAETQAEKDMLAKKLISKVDVLKVGHHGAKETTTSEFLKVAKPTYSIISVGAKNSYKHPTNEVLTRLNTIKSKVYRTDQKGTIIVTSDGEKITISTEKK
ncbi:ComEC/Rec2 family competence protein [Pseudoneobacillus sp. C159]